MYKKNGILVVILFSITLLTGCLFFPKKEYSENDFKDPKQHELAKAIMKKDVKKVEKLAKQTDLHSLSEEGISLLMLSSLEVIDDNRNDNKNSEPLYEIVTILMKEGADPIQVSYVRQKPNLGTPYPDPNKRNAVRPVSCTYSWPATKTPIKLLKAMLDGGLDPNATFGMGFGESALIGNYLYDIDKLKILVEAGANVNVLIKTSSTLTVPLVWQASNVSSEAMLYLLEQGADPNASWEDWTLAYNIKKKLSYLNECILKYESNKDKILEYESNKKHSNYKTMSYNKHLKDLIFTEKARDILINSGVKWPPDIPEKIIKLEEERKLRKEKQ